MEETGIRYVYLEDEELLGILKEKEELNDKIIELNVEIEEVSHKRELLAGQMNKIKDRANALIEPKIKTIEKDEFEDVYSYRLNETKDKIEVTIWDMIIAEKQRIRNERKKKESNV